MLYLEFKDQSEPPQHLSRVNRTVVVMIKQRKDFFMERIVRVVPAELWKKLRQLFQKDLLRPFVLAEFIELLDDLVHLSRAP